LLIMPGVMPFVAESADEAKRKLDRLQALVEPRQALRLLSTFLGVDATGLDLDKPLPDFPATEGWLSRQKLFAELTRRENLTVRGLIDRV
ncbi:hypothetical protein, partial [Clostridioides difficile]|uniref:hypothetical protein n=1 Tax=Clostridioides difficile TaxID=1496 RepID=UPI0018DE6C59